MSRRTRTLVGLAFPLVCLGAWVCAPREPGADETLWVMAEVGAEVRWVQVDAFLPAGRSKEHPAVLLLHGVEGAERNRRSRGRLARELADAGYATFVVHYFDVCDYQDLWLFEGDHLDVVAIEQHCRRDAERWVHAVSAALCAVAARPEVDSRRIALDGYSLGGFVSLAVAERGLNEPAIPDAAALVIHWGGRFETTTIRPGFPPALFVHGERDPVVRRDCAEEACAAITAVGTDAELLVVPGAGHVARTVESDAAVLEFLAARLQPPAAPMHPAFAWTDDEAAQHWATLAVPFP